MADTNGTPLWCNRTTQSTSVCRLLKLEFVKETKNVTLKEYNDRSKQIKETHLKHGISPLHCRIRFFEFIRNLAYKIYVKKCQIRNDENKATVKKTKDAIRNKLWTLLGLRVDIPKIGGFGSSRFYFGLKLFLYVYHVNLL